MKRLIKFQALILLVLMTLSFTSSESKKVKCMIQMGNYEGEGAYVIVTLINPEGKYEETLFVHGDDKEWYYELNEWWKFYGKKRTKLDGITGSTIAGGQRTVSVFQIDASKIDQGYKVRFESAVEAKNYYEKDLEFPLTTSNLQKKFNGKGFIRYIRLLPQ